MRRRRLGVLWLPVVLVAALLLPLPCHGASLFSPHELDALFQRYGQGPEGAAVVGELFDGCGEFGHTTCLRLFGKWRQQRGLHPLTRAAVDWAFLREDLLAGGWDGDLMKDLLAGVLFEFSTELPTGETALLRVDPIWTRVFVQSYVDLVPGEPHHFRSTVESPLSTEVVVLYGGTRPSRLCVNKDCVSPGGSKRIPMDGLLMPVTLLQGENRFDVVWDAETVRGDFKVRLVTPDGAPVSWLSSKGEAGVVMRAPRKVRGNRTARVDQTSMEALLAREDPVARWLAISGLRRNGAVGQALPELSFDEVKGGPLEDQLKVCRLLQGGPGGLACLDHLIQNDWESLEVHVLACEVAVEEQRWWEASLHEREARSRLVEATPLVWKVRHRLAFQKILWQQGMPQQVGYKSLEGLDVVTEGLSDLVVSAADALISFQAWKEARDLLQPYTDKWRRDPTNLLLLVQAAARLGDGQLAEWRARELMSDESIYPPIDVTLAEMYVARGEVTQARETLERIVRKRPHHAYLLLRCAELYHELGDVSQAMSLWLRRLRLTPHDHNVRRLGEKLSGKGSVNDADRGLVSLTKAREWNRSTPPCGNDRYQGIADHRLIRRYPTGNSTTWRTQAIRVCVPPKDGVVTLGFRYDSHLEDARVLRSANWRSNGRNEPASGTTDSSANDEAYNLYYDVREVSVLFEDVEPGDLLYLSYRIDSAPSALGVPFSGIVWLQEAFPRYHNVVTIDAGDVPNLYSQVVSAGADFVVGEEDLSPEGHGIRYLFDYVPALSAEDSTPGPFESVAHIHYSTGRDWPEFASWYSALLEARQDFDPELDELVASFQESAGDEGELLEAICRFVADDVRYVGLELGTHGLQPYSPGSVLRRRFGDCKDMSLLLVTLLRAAGIDAHLVVLSTFPNGHPVLNPVSPSLFDHAIVYLDSLGIYFDPTARFVGLGALPWQDQGAVGIIIDKEEPRLVELPVARAEDNRLEMELSLGAVDESSGLVQVSGWVDLTGQYYWDWIPTLESQEWLQETLEGVLTEFLSGISVTQTSVGSLEGEFGVRVEFEGTLGMGKGESLPALRMDWADTQPLAQPRSMPWVARILDVRRLRLRNCSDSVVLTGAQEFQQSAPGVELWVRSGEIEGCPAVELEVTRTKRRIEALDYPSFLQGMRAARLALSELEVRHE